MAVSGSAAGVCMGRGGPARWPGTHGTQGCLCVCLARICAVVLGECVTEQGEGYVDSVGVPLQQAFVF